MSKARLPPPTFTAAQLRSAIPEELFVRRTGVSFAFLARDLIFAAVVFWFGLFIPLLPQWLRYIVWPLYWFAQGVVLTGLWVIGHECGHESFSDKQWVNYWTGMVVHSALLVPFHSWRISHSSHHKATNHMDRDEVFLPAEQEDVPAWDALAESPLGSFLLAIGIVTVGWPMYLFTGVGGPKNEPSRNRSHFLPSSRIFQPHHWGYVMLSNFGLLVTLSLLGVAYYHFGAWAVFTHYFMPYLFVNYWLVSYTLLHHTHVDVPHYREPEWNFVRGAMATVDRAYGIFDFFHHHIGSTHVVHHLFSHMPHYNAVAANECLKPILGPYYVYDETNPFVALLRSVRDCYCVDYADGNVLYFKSIHEAKAKGRKPKAE